MIAVQVVETHAQPPDDYDHMVDIPWNDDHVYDDDDHMYDGGHMDDFPWDDDHMIGSPGYSRPATFRMYFLMIYMVLFRGPGFWWSKQTSKPPSSLLVQYHKIIF